MKKIWIALLAVSVLTLTACGGSANTLELIGIPSAKAVALEDAGISAASVSNLQVNEGKRNGMEYYTVSFIANETGYVFEIDALTGQIIASRVTPLTLQTAEPAVTLVPIPTPAVTLVPETTPPVTTPTPSAPVTTPAPSAPVTTPVPSQAPVSGITAAQAQEIARKHAGLTAAQVVGMTCVPDYDDGVKVYDVEFLAADGREYDYEIDAATGAIRDVDFDIRDDDPVVSQPPRGEGPAKVSRDQAKALALAQVPGATTSHIREFETDYDDGRVEYEGKIVYNGMEYEFEIDGYSGAIRSWDAERADHD